MTLPPIPGLNPALDELPDRFRTLRPHQIRAVMEIVDGFENEKVVVLDAPTGSGKTIIAEVVRLVLGVRGVYVAHNKELQSQFSRDFWYSPVLWGKANYTPTGGMVMATCADCNKSQEKACDLCERWVECPYQVAKQDAINSPVPVLNSAYWLNTTLNPDSPFANRGLTVIDEADTLEQVLMGQVSVTVTKRMAEEYGIDPPDKLTKEESYVGWGSGVVATLVPVLRELRRRDTTDLRVARRVEALASLLSRVQEMVGGLLDGRQRWVYTGGAGSDRRQGDEISFRPVTVAQWGGQRVWGGDERFLLMSGTVISSDMLLEGLGWEGSHRLVRVESQFPVRNRQVVYRPSADMTRTGQANGSVDGMVRALEKIARDHPDDRMLVHTVSYKLSESLCKGRYPGRPMFTYTQGRDRPEALQSFKETPAAILFAASMDRGIDLPDDFCRVQVIAKVPYPNLGDKQVAERMFKTKNGQTWYAVQVARSLMQMAGRGVRHEDDFCVCYVLDSSFGRWYAQWQLLLPAWFRASVRFEL